MSISIIDSMRTQSAPPYIIVHLQESTSILADSTSFIEIELLGSAANGYLTEPNKLLTGKSYAIELKNLSISCLSQNFEVGVLNINDELKVNTFYEVLKYSSNNLTCNKLPNIVIRNRDVVFTNKIYLMITNNDHVNATGVIDIELCYITLQDREI